MRTNTALVVEASRLSRVANSFGSHGAENFGELVEGLTNSGVDIATLSAELLAKICDFADAQRQIGFTEGVRANQSHGDAVLGGYDSTTDTVG